MPLEAWQIALLLWLAAVVAGAVFAAHGELNRDRRERRVELARTAAGVVEVPIPYEGLLNARGCTCDRCTYPRAFHA